MVCEKCEIVRAKLIAGALRISGRSLVEIANDLSTRYGSNYFVSDEQIIRMSKCPPFQKETIL